MTQRPRPPAPKAPRPPPPRPPQAPGRPRPPPPYRPPPPRPPQANTARLTKDNAARLLVELDRALVEAKGLREFVEIAWPEVEPVRFMSNWHVDAICEHLQALSKGELTKLVINIPPGCMKSLTVAVFWPIWQWIVDPSHKFIFSSYDAKLSLRDARRARDLLNSPWFQRRWGFGLVDEKPDLTQPIRGKASVCVPWQNTRAGTFYENNHKGFRYSTSIGGAVTGRHADSLVVDDPHKADEGRASASGVGLQAAADYWDQTLSTRMANPETTRRLVIMQRIHEGDLTGHLAERGFESLVLPMRFDPSERCTTSIGFVDPRKDEGELLWPERFPEEVVDDLVKTLGPFGAASQLQQRPVPAGGAIFKAEMFARTYDEPPNDARWILSVDCAFKGADSSDPVSAQVWAKKGSDFYLIDNHTRRLDIVGTLDLIRTLLALYPQVTGTYVEDRANGPAVLRLLQGEVSGLVAWPPKGERFPGKEERAHAVVPLFAAGNVKMPNAEKAADWLPKYMSEMLGFPRSKHDDQVDATTMALLVLHDSKVSSYLAALDRLVRSR